MTQDPKTALMVEVEHADAATTLIARAIEKGVPIETMERLLAMRRELKAEAAREAFFLALAAFQSECPVIHKGEAVAGRDGKVRYHYAPLEAIVSQVKTILFRHGFSYTLDTEQPEGRLIGICRAHHIGGHAEETRMEVPVGSDYMTAQQMVGAARTYATRYAFCNAFGILTGDEDNDAAIPAERADVPVGVDPDTGQLIDEKPNDGPRPALRGVVFKPVRPYTPERVKQGVETIANRYAESGKKASEKQRNFARVLLSGIMPAEGKEGDLERHSVLAYLTGKESLKPDAMPDWYVLAVLDWLKPVPAKDGSGNFEVGHFVAEEAAAVLTASLKAAGQTELPIAETPTEEAE